jgi:penicillin-binding protein 1C
VPRLIGRSAAAPILFDAFARLPAPPAPLPRAPEGVVATTSAKLPPPLKRFAPGDRAGALARLHILFPPDGARLELRSTADRPDAVPLKITGGVAPLTVLVNGVPALAQPRGSLFFQPQGPGFARVTVIDGDGAADSVVVRLEDGASSAAASAAEPACPLTPCGRP